MRYLRVFIGAIFTLFLFSSCGRTSQDEVAVFPQLGGRNFAAQTALPIDAIGDAHLSFILLDDGSLWAFGWASDGTRMEYSQIPFFVMDDADEIFTENDEIFAMIDGEAVRLAPYRRGLSLNFIDGEIWASGEFLRGHVARDEMLYVILEESVKVWSADDGFIPNQQILTGNWQISSSADGSLNPPSPHDRYGIRFSEDGTKVMATVYADVAHWVNRWTFIPYSERQWSIMQDGRVKVEDAQTGLYETFAMQLSRNQDSTGIFDNLVLISSDFYKIMWRSR
ncbi:MAG: hypothetical protein FWE44_02155 [Defluviitaleaceae bacterium]|nr:hypothetical protein [Defluviitaleaceae bacterium]